MSLMPSDEIALLNDGRYKNFIATLEKVLKQFEYSSEWADLITNLVKVKKAIESYPKFQSIPKRITLSKRLAQCLHPALPSGVHLKTLEVYETIFRMIGKRNLQRDIILYSCGLFPLLPAAALPVKPVLLTLYETYFLPLGDALNPILTGFLLGLFPALEEGADYYERICALLDNLANRIDKFYFYTCIWSAIHLVAAARYPALTFILNHFDKRKTMEDQLYLMGSSVETMVSAVCTCLQDREQSLVQRSILDFLLVCLPMHNKQLTKIDMMKIITGTLHLLLKRDMSLNRRIYAWFLGTEQSPNDNSNQQQTIAEIHASTTSLAVTNDPFDSSSYFIQYTQENLIQSLLHALETISSGALLTAGKMKPSTSDENSTMILTIADAMPATWTLTKLIRVLIILVDKPDVGPNILESILMSYLLVVHQQVYLPAKQLTSINSQQESTRTEALKTLNMLLDTFEPYFIWEFLTKNFDVIINDQHDTFNLITAGTTIEQLCGIINMLLDIASLESSTDIQSEHLPEMLYRMIKTMNNNISKFTADQITLCIEILLKILKKVVPTDSTHRLSIFRRSASDDILSISEQKQSIENNLFTEVSTESETDDDNDDEQPDEQRFLTDNDYTTDNHNKLVHTDSADPPPQESTVETEQQSAHDIERLLRRLVRKVEKRVSSQMLNESKKCPDEQQRKILTKTMLQSMNHLEKSITLYKIFFHRFVTTFLIDMSKTTLNEKFQNIYSITQKKTNENILALFNHYQQLNEFQLKLYDHVDHYKRAFDDCCKLLIEFCCFPRQSSVTDQSTLSKGKTEFDDWSIDLCVLSVCESRHFFIQTIAISVLIELLSYTLCLNDPKALKESNETITGTNLTLPEHISIIPSFNHEQVSLLINETLFFQHITAYLWEHLSEKYDRQCNVKASRILSMLHSMLPNCDCEDLICNQLSLTHIQHCENEVLIIEAYKRFFKLWNSTRDISIVTYGHLSKTFERCLLIVISVLNESNNHCLKSIVQQWTYDCFVHGDMCRIFDILLIMLLHPDTARISVQKLHPVAHREYFLSRQVNSIDQLSMNSNYQQQESNISNDTDDMSVGDINEITFSVPLDDGTNDDYAEEEDDDDDDDTYDDDEAEQEESDEEKRICAISCTDTGEVVYHLKQSSPQPMKYNAVKPPTTLSLSQPSLTNNSRSVSPTTSAKSVKRRAPTMPTVFSRNNSSLESSSNKGSNGNIQRMYASLYEETSTETNSLNESQISTSTVLSHLSNSTRRPHSVGPIPHATTIDGLSDPPTTPLKSLNEADALLLNNNATKKVESVDRSRKIDFHLAYLLLYTQPYDYNRVTFALNIIESLLDLIPRQLTHTFLITSNVQLSPINMHNNRLHELCLRHRRSIEGRNFYSSIDTTFTPQHQSYLYTLLNLLLIYTRSYYSKSFEHRLTAHDMQGNRKVHIRSLTLLKRICQDLSYLCMEYLHLNASVINYIHELFQKLSFQKTILHLFNSTIEKINMKTRSNKLKTLTKTIYDTNIESLYDELTRQYLRELVQLLEEIVLLENILQHYQHRHENSSNPNTMNALASNLLSSTATGGCSPHGVKNNEYSSIGSFHFRNHSDLDYVNLIYKTNQLNTSTNPLRYIDNQPIVNQLLFISSILQYLKQIDFIENHRHIINLVVRILPHCGSSLKSISSMVIEQICRNLCFVVQTHNQPPPGIKIRFKQLPYFDVIEYIVHLIQRLSYMCNYCLLGNGVDSGQGFTSTLGSQHWMKPITLNERDLSEARQSILNQLSSVLSSLLFIWKTISEHYIFDSSLDQLISTAPVGHSSANNNIWAINSVKQIRQTILDFVSSLTRSNGVPFISAVVQCWGERKRQQRTQQKTAPQTSSDTASRTILTMPRDNIGETQALIDIVMNIQGYTINDMIPNMNELLRNQSTDRDKKKQNYDVWCFQFLLAYLQNQKSLSIDCWPTLAFMFKECLSQSVSPPATFLIIRILSFYIKQSPSLVERRDLKDLQDITMRVLDHCNTIVASSLEQTTWLRKNLQVRVPHTETQSVKSGSTGNPQTPMGTGGSNESSHLPVDEGVDFDARDALATVMHVFDKLSTKMASTTVLNLTAKSVSQAINTSDLAANGNYSLLALSVLAEHAAALLDIVYNRTDEKDRVVLPFLQNLVTNVMPYVRTHVSSNAPSYRSASALLMSISQYSYTRKAWKKEAFEQLFDVAFFQLDIMALRSWKVIVDNMITSERPTSFRDVMTKINTVQTGLFVSKEHEYEQRAMLVKRFAFVIYASEKDQYNRQLPEILERIADLLKLPQVPVLHTQMFLFLRVLLLRISTRNLISLWPILMAELIQVLLQLEQDLLADLDGDAKSHVQRLVTNDLASTSITASSTNSNPALKMYLYACKLLDVLLAMPYSELHHFQLFRSAFVTDEDATDRKSINDTFIAFSIRLSKLLERKLLTMPAAIRDRLPMINRVNRPLLRLRTISHIIELYPFFDCLTRMHTYDHHHYQHSLSTHTNLTNRQLSLPKIKESSKKKAKSSTYTSSSALSSSSSSSHKRSESTANSLREETMDEIETSVMEDFLESWT